MENDIQRFLLCEETRQKCAAEYLRSPHDPENLTTWGSALLELAQFQQGEESLVMLEDAKSKLEAALKINPKRHETLWNMGNAHTCHGFLLPDAEEANEHFKKAAACFQDAYNEQPNELYLKCLDMAQQAPVMHQQVHAQGIISSGKNSSGSGSSKKKKKSRNGDLAYDILGWVVLAIGLVAWIGMANVAKTPAPPSK